MQSGTDVEKNDKVFTEFQSAQPSARLCSEEQKVNATMSHYEKLQHEWAARRTSREQETLRLHHQVASLRSGPAYSPSPSLSNLNDPVFSSPPPPRPATASCRTDARFYDMTPWASSSLPPTASDLPHVVTGDGRNAYQSFQSPSYAPSFGDTLVGHPLLP